MKKLKHEAELFKAALRTTTSLSPHRSRRMASRNLHREPYCRDFRNAMICLRTASSPIPW